MGTDTKNAERTAVVSVSAHKLRQMLGAVLPHAGEDDTLPVIESVQFEVRAGWLYLTATDRYTIGVARCQIPGAESPPVADRSALLWVRDAHEMHRMLERGEGVAAVIFGGKSLAVDLGKGRMAGWETTEGNYPDWRKLMSKLLEGAPAPLGDGRGINPVNLAKFAQARADDHAAHCDSPLRMRVLGEGPTLLFTLGGWFLGALMPTRIDRYEHAPDVPAQWAAWTAVTAQPEAESEGAAS